MMKRTVILEYKDFKSWSYMIVLKENKKYLLTFSKHGTAIIRLRTV